MFKIAEKVVSSKHVNRYVVEVLAKFPKSDGEAILEIGGFEPGKDDTVLKDLVNTLENLVKAYPSGRSDQDQYLHIEGYEEWFAPGSLTDEDMEALPLTQQMNAVEWLADPNGQPGSRATFDSFNIYHYDENGEKWTVVYENGHMKRVHSSSIKEVGYTASTKQLRVMFNRGSIYVYDDVPEHVYEEMMDSKSIGSFLNRNIKPHYNYHQES